MITLSGSLWLVYVTGVLEIAGAVGLLIRDNRGGRLPAKRSGPSSMLAASRSTADVSLL